jgi:hypothetical protein
MDSIAANKKSAPLRLVIQASVQVNNDNEPVGIRFDCLLWRQRQLRLWCRGVTTAGYRGFQGQFRVMLH